jgi:hypothetical protein
MADQDTLQPGSGGRRSGALARDVADGFRQNLCSMLVQLKRRLRAQGTVLL